MSRFFSSADSTIERSMAALSSWLTSRTSFWRPLWMPLLPSCLGRTDTVTTTLALVLLYVFMAGFFAVLLIIADRIRHAGDSVCLMRSLCNSQPTWEQLRGWC